MEVLYSQNIVSWQSVWEKLLHSWVRTHFTCKITRRTRKERTRGFFSLLITTAASWCILTINHHDTVGFVIAWGNCKVNRKLPIDWYDVTVVNLYKLLTANLNLVLLMKLTSLLPCYCTPSAVYESDWLTDSTSSNWNDVFRGSISPSLKHDKSWTCDWPDVTLVLLNEDDNTNTSEDIQEQCHAYR